MFIVTKHVDFNEEGCDTITKKVAEFNTFEDANIYRQELYKTQERQRDLLRSAKQTSPVRETLSILHNTNYFIIDYDEKYDFRNWRVVRVGIY